MSPLFSIITVTRNAAATLPVTLASVAGQSCRLYEWIVMDGASTDGTQQLVNDAAETLPALTLVSEPDAGIYDAMNKALALAKGEYVVFLNAGDAFYDSETLQLLADAAMDNDFPGIIYGDTVIVNAQGRVLGPRHLSPPAHLTLESFSEGMLVCHQAFVVLRKLAGWYDLQYSFSADYEWCIRCIQRSRRNVYVSEPPLVRYLNVGMTTRNMRRSLLERFNIMCKYYGTASTVRRHARFLMRFLRRTSLKSSE